MPRPRDTEAAKERGAELGRKVRQKRKDAEMPVEMVAVRARVSVDYLRRIEQGRVANPGVFTVSAIASAIEVGIDELISQASPRQQ
jgi:transcriptional regulator with XRE-family HTH domain